MTLCASIIPGEEVAAQAIASIEADYESLLGDKRPVFSRAARAYKVRRVPDS